MQSMKPFSWFEFLANSLFVLCLGQGWLTLIGFFQESYGDTPGFLIALPVGCLLFFGIISIYAQKFQNISGKIKPSWIFLSKLALALVALTAMAAWLGPYVDAIEQDTLRLGANFFVRVLWIVGFIRVITCLEKNSEQQLEKIFPATVGLLLIVAFLGDVLLHDVVHILLPWNTQIALHTAWQIFLVLILNTWLVLRWRSFTAK